MFRNLGLCGDTAFQQRKGDVLPLNERVEKSLSFQDPDLKRIRTAFRPSFGNGWRAAFLFWAVSAGNPEAARYVFGRRWEDRKEEKKEETV